MEIVSIIKSILVSIVLITSGYKLNNDDNTKINIINNISFILYVVVWLFEGVFW